MCGSTAADDAGNDYYGQLKELFPIDLRKYIKSGQTTSKTTLVSYPILSCKLYGTFQTISALLSSQYKENSRALQKNQVFVEEYLV